MRWAALGKVGSVMVGNIRIGGPRRIGLGWGIEEEIFWSAGVSGLRGRWIRGFFVFAFLNTGFEMK